VETAINYVGGVSDTLRDPVAKMNAQTTLAKIQELHQFEVSRALDTGVAGFPQVNIVTIYSITE
jgi:hypothetical protein